MYQLFAILLSATIFTGFLAIPFINLLYKLRFRYKRVINQEEKAGITVSKLHEDKAGTPTGGGVLIIGSVLLFSILYYRVSIISLNWASYILLFTLILFGGIGLYDDLRKMIRVHGRKLQAFPKFPKLVLQLIFGLVVGYMIYLFLGISTITIPVFDFTINLGIFYIVFAMIVIVFMSNAFNITDGLDGLATGLLLIALTAYWVLAQDGFYSMDVALFIAVIMGSLIAFLYFNIYPARIFMGDTGSMALGAMLAVISLILNQSLVAPIIGGVFVIEFISSFIQVMSKKFRNGKRIFKIAPLHFHFQAEGWDETKVTMRFWIFGILCAFWGLLIATF